MVLPFQTLAFFDNEILLNLNYVTSPRLTHLKVKVGKAKEPIDKIDVLFNIVH